MGHKILKTLVSNTSSILMIVPSQKQHSLFIRHLLLQVPFFSSNETKTKERFRLVSRMQRAHIYLSYHLGPGPWLPVRPARQASRLMAILLRLNGSTRAS
ncbi:hypothetical protein CEXT_767021 [Caerostris extrusa]|uniref:Uncharacterized protein n=1 Tax=Caerostris extrusa TaxID=172846 RepID=A0AAV4WW92_CAEEX|nr:hypothetical protein CEXT_767021 [Caerostris extrusa]